MWVPYQLPSMLWQLAAFSDPRSRNPQRTLELVQKGAALLPKDGTICLALGMAHYRAGNVTVARECLEKAMELRNGGDPSDWFTLAMIDCKLGDKEKARQWYAKANTWMENHSHEHWTRLRAEAAFRMGLFSCFPLSVM